MIHPNEQDKLFTDSPDTGHPDCLCSRCGKAIPENQVAIRMWPEGSNTEYRFCQECCEKEGMTFSKDYEEEI